MIGRIAAPVALLSLCTAAAEPLTADRLPPRLLADCDARAETFGRFSPPVAEAAAALIDIGAVTAADFQGARIGFCDLQRAGGPVAAASCGDGVILLDAKYAVEAEALPLRATLAHEMTHHLQHQDRKARYGAGYCDSPRYADDKPALEAEADAFGDKVAELFALGRAVEIVNACDEPVAIYLEADDPVAVRGAAPAFQRVPARGKALSHERAVSGRFRFYAQSHPSSGPPRHWQDKTSAQSRFVEGRLVRLKEIQLAPTGRADGPFRLRLSCAGDGG